MNMYGNSCVALNNIFLKFKISGDGCDCTYTSCVVLEDELRNSRKIEPDLVTKQGEESHDIFYFPSFLSHYSKRGCTVCAPL